MSPAVYVQTSDATENEVIAFSRAGGGALAPLGRYWAPTRRKPNKGSHAPAQAVAPARHPANRVARPS
jgi:hypothetical protein